MDINPTIKISLLFVWSILQGCGGTHSVLESGNLATALPASLVRLPPKDKSTLLQTELSLQAIYPFQSTIPVSRIDTSPAPLRATFDPLVASATASIFLGKGTHRFWIGCDVVHELTSYRIGYGRAYTPATEDHRVEVDYEFGRTTLIQDTRWDNLDYGSFGRTYLNQPYKTNTSTKSKEVYAKIGATVSGIPKGLVGTIEFGLYPVGISSLVNRTTERVLVGSAGLGWLFSTSRGDCAVLFRYASFSGKRIYGLESKWATNFGLPAKVLKPTGTVRPVYHHPFPNPLPSDWPDSREAADSTIQQP
jgi:hypothetical protein